MQQRLLLLWLLHCLWTWQQCHGATDVRAEVAKLRAELSAALEADEPQPNPSGVIVQPAWTQDVKTAGSSTAQVAAGKVVASKAALSEAAKLRAEINSAVASDAYAVGMLGNAQQVRKLEAELRRKGSNHETPKVSMTREELLGGGQQQEEPTANQPNVVDSMASSYDSDIDLDELHHLELSKRRTREMLILARIVEDFSFTLGADVEEWLHMQHNGSSILVGRRREDLLLVQADSTGYKPRQTLQVPASMGIVVAYERWDAMAELHEGIILVAVQTQLHWYRARSANSEYALAWHWQVGSTISSITPFSMEGLDYLVIGSSQAISIYAYNLAAQEFWIAQRIQLAQACSAVAVLDTGRDLLLAVGQQDQTLVYSYNTREQPPNAALHLQLRHTLESPQIAHIAAFEMGGHSYLALGGHRPQILQYAQGQLLAHTILGQHFGLVELFLPVPVHTYRDDLLLLVQHRVHFDTHAVAALEMLVWNGEAFEASVPAPCQLGTQTPHAHGVACMLDVQREAGIQGAARFGQADMPLLLVPRQQVQSGLFQLHTELLPRNSELHDLQDIYDFMRDWVKEQDALLQLAERLLSQPRQHDYVQVDTPMLINEGATLQAIYVNDALWTTADASTDMHHVIHEIRLLEQRLATPAGMRAKRQLQLFHFDYDQLDLDEVEATELSIDKLNHVRFYVQNATLQFNGTLNVQQLELLPPAALPVAAANTTTVPLLQLSEDLACDYINGIRWSEFLEDLVWRQQPLKLPQLHVKGDVIFEQALQLQTLNELRFPDDFLWSYANSTSIVAAPKNFTQTLSVNSVDTMGTINGMNPLDAITLSDEQSWPNAVTFTQLEVSEALELNGRAQAREQLEQAPANPTLLEARQINASCHFEELIVNGTLRLLGQLDNESFDALIGDLAQRSTHTGDVLTIAGAKRFENLSLPVDAHVLDGAINGIAIEDFVTKHTPQTLHNLSSLLGYVYFKKLQLTGHYDGVNITALLQQAVRIDAPLQAPTTWLNFVQQGQLLCERPASVHVKRRLNDVPLATDYQLLHAPLYLHAAHFEQLAAQQLDVSHDLTGNARLNGRQLDELLGAQAWTGDVYVRDLELPQGVQVSRLQRWQTELLLPLLQQLDELPLLILGGELDIERILVAGNVQLTGALNGQNWAQLQRNVVWLHQSNELRARWSFAQPPLFARDLNVLGAYNDQPLAKLVADIVFRQSQATPVYIVAPKSFVQPLRVLGQAQVAALNGVPFARLANKRQPLQLAGSVQLAGRLHVDKLQLAGQLNGVDCRPLSARLSYDAVAGVYVQRGRITLPAQQQLADLYVQGHFGNSSEPPLAEFLRDLVYKKQPLVQLQGRKTFAGRVSIQRDAQIEQLNGLPLAELLQQLIFIDDDETVTVQTPVRFAAPVQLAGALQIAGQLVLQQGLLNGCNVSEWLSDVVRVDQPWQLEHRVVFAPGALDNNELQLRYVNDVEMSRLLTLNTDQHLSTPFVCQQLHLVGTLEVQGLVNDVNLTQAYANTLLINAPHTQVVKTPLIMQTLRVSGPLDVLSPVNSNPSLNLSDVASLSEPELRLQTPLYFAALHTPQLQTTHQISGIMFTDWHERSLWARGRPLQTISGNWSVSNLRVMQPAVSPPPPHQLFRRQTVGNRLLALCARFTRIFDWLHLPYHVKQLEQRFVLRLAANQSDIRRIFVLQSPASGGSYLLINERGCWTHIYRWNGARFAAANSFQSGAIDDVAAVQPDNSTSQQFYYLSSNERSEHWNCSVQPELPTWQVAARARHAEAPLLAHLQQQPQPPPDSHYQRGIKYLNRPNALSVLRPHLRASQPLVYSDYSALLARLLKDLSSRLHTEVNITQLSIPESDLYDEQLIEQFLELINTLQQQQLYPPHILAPVEPATLPLPDNPARVLAARSVQIIWPVIVQLEALHGQLPSQPPHAHAACEALKQTLGQAVRDVLLLANNGTTMTNYTPQLHAVIERLRRLQIELQQPQLVASSRQSLPASQHSLPLAKSVETLRLYVGPASRARLLYARLNIVQPAVPPASAAHIQIHHANGSLFQSLAAAHTACQLTTLRVRDETLLAFVEHCCRVRIFIYRGIEGFVPFAQFTVDSHVVQLTAMRLSLPRPPGVMYALAVAQSRQINFYELIVVGLLEPWLHCK